MHTVGVREVQRALGFSSPSIAVHHLEKLQDLGLVRKKGTGEYMLEEEVKVGILRFFTRMGRFLVPRYLFYSVLFSTMLTAYLTLCTLGQTAPSFYAVVFGLIAVLIFWFETIRLWRTKPFWNFNTPSLKCRFQMTFLTLSVDKFVKWNFSILFLNLRLTLNRRSSRTEVASEGGEKHGRKEPFRFESSSCYETIQTGPRHCNLPSLWQNIWEGWRKNAMQRLPRIIVDMTLVPSILFLLGSLEKWQF